MILDKLLLSNVGIIGKTLLNRADIKDYPKNIDEMELFLNTLKQSIDKNEFDGVLVGNILFSFVSDQEIRDRNTTSRTFEDIFTSLFSQECSDKSKRSNPSSTEEIRNLDILCADNDWKISTDLSGNKREKADLILGNYHISLKTLKGAVIDENEKIIDSKTNDELNVGSLSFRALLKGILTDDEIKTLGDRKSGLGSGSQLRKNIFDPIKVKLKEKDFQDRLELYLRYVYEEDMYIILKSHYRIDFYLIPNDSFIKSLVYTYSKNETEFEKIFYRWENNNLRLRWKNMLSAMDKYSLPYSRININLKNINQNIELNTFKGTLNKQIENFIKLHQTK